MRALLGIPGFLALTQGVQLLLYAAFDLTGGGFVRRWDLVQGREVFAGIVLIVLAVALFAASERAKEGG